MNISKYLTKLKKYSYICGIQPATYCLWFDKPSTANNRQGYPCYSSDTTTSYDPNRSADTYIHSSSPPVVYLAVLAAKLSSSHVPNNTVGMINGGYHTLIFYYLITYIQIILTLHLVIRFKGNMDYNRLDGNNIRSINWCSGFCMEGN